MKNLEKSRFFLCLKFYNVSFLTNLTATVTATQEWLK